MRLLDNWGYSSSMSMQMQGRAFNLRSEKLDKRQSRRIDPPSSGVGLRRRSSSVCHRAVISRTKSAIKWSRSSWVRSGLCAMCVEASRTA